MNLLISVFTHVEVGRRSVNAFLALDRAAKKLQRIGKTRNTFRVCRLQANTS